MTGYQLHRYADGRYTVIEFECDDPPKIQCEAFVSTNRGLLLLASCFWQIPMDYLNQLNHLTAQKEEIDTKQYQIQTVEMSPFRIDQERD